MSLSLTQAFDPKTQLNLADRYARAEIDRSCQTPVMLFFASAIFWLIVGTLLGLIAALKMNFPELLDGPAWLTFGRLRPAHLNIVAYGWASSVGLGVAIWLMARLCRFPILSHSILISAAIIWNLGVLVGLLGILAGDGRSIEWLEFPSYASPVLFVAFALMAIWGIIMFRFRKPGHVYVSQWYLLAALLWFPWLYASANMALIWKPISGSAQGAINWWYGHNALGLWFTPIGLAAIYYLIPKVIGRPIHSYYLSILGFWSLALFYSWNGMHHLIGGPFPSWLVSASIVASIMMFIPVITVAINHHMTMRGNFEALRWSPTLRFTVFGAMMYTLVSLQGSSMAIPQLNARFHFTDYTVGHAHLGLYAFYTMVMFGAIYYIAPRLMNWEWPSANLIRWHFWLSAIGISLMVISLSVGGIFQGLALHNPSVNFMETLTIVWPYRLARSISGVILLIAHILFAVHFVFLALRIGKPRTEPTLLATIPQPTPTPKTEPIPA